MLSANDLQSHLVSFVFLFPERYLLFTPNSQIFSQYLSSVLFSSIISWVWAYRRCLCFLSTCSANMLCYQWWEGNFRLVRKWKNFALVCAKLLWPAIYCDNPRSKTDPHPRSLSLRGLGRQDLWIIKRVRSFDYNWDLNVNSD